MSANPVTIALLREAEKAQNCLHPDDCKIVDAARDAVELIESLTSANNELIDGAKEAAEVLEDTASRAKDLRKAIARAAI